MRLLSLLLRYSSRSVILAFVIGIASGASSTSLLALINTALKYEGEARTRLVWYFIGLCLLMPLTRVASEILLAHLGQKALFDVRLRLSRQTLNLPLHRLEQLGADRLLTVLTEDVPSICNAINVIPVLFINGALMLGCLFYLGWLSTTVLLWVFGFIVLGVITYRIPVTKSMHYFGLVRRDADALFESFRALIAGNKELKLHFTRRQAFTSDLLIPAARSSRRNNIMAMWMYTIAASWGHLLVFIAIGLIVFVLPVMTSVDAEILTGYTLGLLFITTPIMILVSSTPQLARANVAMRNVEDLGLVLASDTEIEPDAPPQPVVDWQHLALSNVKHVYNRDGDDNGFTLGPISSVFTPGEIVFVTGGNGSGKTTFVKVLAGLYIPESGEIRLNGEVINDECREYYRQHFSVVFYDFYLFQSLLGLKSSDIDEKAYEYLTYLKLDNKLKINNGVLSSTSLSQGQRRRLALLTAYLEDRPVYIFDEWAAEQDQFFKELFYYQIVPDLKKRGKTVILVSHDDKYYSVGDRIIKLESGKIISDEAISFGRPHPIYAEQSND